MTRVATYILPHILYLKSHKMKKRHILKNQRLFTIHYILNNTRQEMRKGIFYALKI